MSDTCSMNVRMSAFFMLIFQLPCPCCWADATVARDSAAIASPMPSIRFSFMLNSLATKPRFIFILPELRYSELSGAGLRAVLAAVSFTDHLRTPGFHHVLDQVHVHLRIAKGPPVDRHQHIARPGAYRSKGRVAGISHFVSATIVGSQTKLAQDRIGIGTDFRLQAVDHFLRLFDTWHRATSRPGCATHSRTRHFRNAAGARADGTHGRSPR